MAVLRQADVLVRYGVDVILASRIQQGLIRGRATGPDLFLAASESLDRAGLHLAYRLTKNPGQLCRRNLDSPLGLARVITELLLGTGSVLPPVPPQSTP